MGRLPIRLARVLEHPKAAALKKREARHCRHAGTLSIDEDDAVCDVACNAHLEMAQDTQAELVHSVEGLHAWDRATIEDHPLRPPAMKWG